MNNPIMHHNSRGQGVKLSFDSDHHRDLEEAAGRVFTVPVCLTMFISEMTSEDR